MRYLSDVCSSRPAHQVAPTANTSFPFSLLFLLFRFLSLLSSDICSSKPAHQMALTTYTSFPFLFCFTSSSHPTSAVSGLLTDHEHKISLALFSFVSTHISCSLISPSPASITRIPRASVYSLPISLYFTHSLALPLLSVYLTFVIFTLAYSSRP